MTAEHAKTQNSNTQLHSQIYQHYTSCRHRPKLFDCLSSHIDPHSNRKRAPPLPAASGYSLPHGHVLYYHSTDVEQRRTADAGFSRTWPHIDMPSSTGGWKFAKFLGELHASVCHVVGDRFLWNNSKFLPAVGKHMTIYGISTSS